MKRKGYGLLGLLPDQLLSLTLPQYFDMLDAKLTYSAIQDDGEMERTAWFTSLLMTASGSYGKKGIEPSKLYERRYDAMGDPIATKHQGIFTPIDKEKKDSEMNKLIAKFNKE